MKSFLIHFIALVCLIGNNAIGQVSVTYKVDITNYLSGGATLGANGIRIAGNFTTRGSSLPNWNPTAAASAMTNEGNNIWSITVTYPDSAKGKIQRYKFVNNNWGTNEGSDSLLAGGCAVLDGMDINRVLTIPTSNQTYSFCWDRCRACIVTATVATVTTTAATAITQTTATAGGNVTTQGSAPVTARGVVWSTTANPTIALTTKTTDGTGTGAFTSNLTGLTANTTYFVRAYATSTAGTAYGNQVQFTTQSTQTGTPVNVTYKVDMTNFLAVGGTIGANGIRIGGNFADRGTSLPNWTPSAAACAMTNEGNNIWSITVTYPDSSKGKNQRYKFVNNDWGTNEGLDSLLVGGCGVQDGSDINRILTIPATNQTYSFCWDRCRACIVTATVATVTTTAATAITQTTATAGGNVTAQGSAPVTARGVVWSTTANPTIALTTKTTDGTGNGAFTSNLTGLTANTTYFVRAYATSTAGTAYGNQIQFSTLPAQTGTPVTVTYKVDITNYLANGAVLAANGMRIAGDFTSRGSTIPNWNPTAAASAMTNEGNNIWSITVTYPDSSKGKKQLYKFVNGNWGSDELSDSVVINGCGEGADRNRFLIIPTTNSTVSYCWERCAPCIQFLPTITTTGSTGISQNSAISGGTITSAGSAGVTARGVVWDTSPNPTIVLSTKTQNGQGTGNFVSNLTGLLANTTYYARAYATSSIGTAYGNQIQFSTLPSQTGTPVLVTYKVDITNYLAGGATLGANGIRIGGNFADRGTSLPNWTPSAAACAMTNEGNNIWSITVTYPDSSKGKNQRYKFVNNNWGTNEGSDSLLAGGCGVQDGSDVNRTLTIPTTNQTYAFCWDRCQNCLIISVEDVKKDGKVQLYPNPFSSEFNIEIPQRLVGSNYEVTNVLGEVVERGKLSGKDGKIGSASFTKGAYFLRIEGETKGFRIVKM